MELRRSRTWMPSRREVMTAGASALALTTGSGFAQPPAVASGTVFEDRGGTGAPTGDRGIAGVMVSNGRDVVRTDADGRWRLPVAEGDSLFVIKPPHWTHAAGPRRRAALLLSAPADGSPGRLSPCRRRAHRSAARLDRFRADAAGGGAFEALLLSDTQPENDAELAYLRDDIVAGVMAPAPPSPSTTAMWCSTICRSIRATCSSWAPPAFRGTIAPATTTSTRRRPTMPLARDMEARVRSAATTPSSRAGARSSCSTTCTTSAATPACRGAAAMRPDRGDPAGVRAQCAGARAARAARRRVDAHPARREPGRHRAGRQHR